MTRIQRLVIYALTLVAVFVIAVIWYLTPTQRATSQLLQTEISFPELKQTPFSEAISIAETKIRQAHPRLKLFRIVHIDGTEQTEDFEHSHGKSWAVLPDLAADQSTLNGITLPKLTCPAHEWLRYISELFGCAIYFDAGCVHLTSDHWSDDPTLGWFKSYISPPPK